ncbi:GGDEF domain-containing protein [Escherichia coli]|nr:GGDEF domain-containing protein [Escherichia coli]
MYGFLNVFLLIKTGNDNGDRRIIFQLGDWCVFSARPDDLLARVGGEEFGVLLTDIDTERAKALAERIRENVERLTGDNPEYAIPQKVTISIGAVVTQENALNPNEIYRLADNALYEAKENGRNKVVVRDVVNFCESP